VKRFELILLGLLAFVMPSLETPKTLFWALYVITVLVRRWREGELLTPPREVVVWAVWGMLLVSLVSTLVNWPLDNGFKGLFDAIRYSALFLCLVAGGYSEPELRRIAWAIIAGTLLGLAYGLLEYVTNVVPAFQFHSAGVITQSSVYLGMVIVLAFAMLMSPGRPGLPVRLLLLVLLVLMGIALAYMGSRGAMLAVVLVLGVILLLNFNRRAMLLSAAGLALVSVIAIGLVQLFPHNLLHEFKPIGHERFSVERFRAADSERIENWRIAMAKLTTGEDLVWGIGPRNYKSIDPATLGIESSFYARTGELHHAHNLLLNRLIEQGIAGLATLLLFGFLVARELSRQWRARHQAGLDWRWCAGFGALVVPLITGLFNTPFYQEHAMLAMLLMGTLYTRRPSPG